MRTDTVREPDLERQGKRLAVPGARFLALGIILAIPGAVMFVLGHSWVAAIGIALCAVAVPPAALGIGALLSALVARWAARHKSFA
jgi:hypothetical protein